MKKFIFIIFLILNACGYQSVNKIDKLNYNISKYKLLGNKEINKILKKNFDKNNNNMNYENNFEIVAKSSLETMCQYIDPIPSYPYIAPDLPV